MPPLALRKLLTTILVFALMYGAFLAGALGLGLGIGVERVLTSAAVGIMSIAATTPVERRVEVEQADGKLVYDIALAAGAEIHRARLGHVFHAQNLLLFGALALATPGLALRRRLGALAAGGALIAGLDVCIIMGDLWHGERTLLNVDARTGLTQELSQLGEILRWMHPTGGAFMAPTFVWGLLLLGPWRREVMKALAQTDPAPPGRPARR